MAQIRQPRRGRSELKTEEKASKVSVKLGDPLEYRVSRLFIHLGFFVRRGRELYTVGRLDTATDLDVLAIRYTDPFHREVQISECKGGSEGPLDRLFWLSGVKRYVNASHATLVRRATKWNIKDFGTELGVELLDFPRLEEMEKASGVDPNAWPGASDRDYYVARQNEWGAALSRNQNLGELYATLAGEVRFHDPFGAINYLLYQLRFLTRDLVEQRSVSESLTRFLLAEAVAQLAMFFMRVAETTIGLSAEDRDGFIRKGLTYGHIDARLVERIFRNAHRITSEMIKHNTGRNIPVDQSFFSMPEPPNVKEIQEVVRVLVARPTTATTFGPIVDLIVQERFVKQRAATDWLGKIFPYSNLRDRVTLAHDYLRILRGIDAVPEVLFSTERSAKTVDLSEPPKSEPQTEGSAAKQSAASPTETAPPSGAAAQDEHVADSKQNGTRTEHNPVRLFE